MPLGFVISNTVHAQYSCLVFVDVCSHNTSDCKLENVGNTDKLN